MLALNPVLRVCDQINEVIRAHEERKAATATTAFLPLHVAPVETLLLLVLIVGSVGWSGQRAWSAEWPFACKNCLPRAAARGREKAA